jgi:hypothetical protein
MGLSSVSSTLPLVSAADRSSVSSVSSVAVALERCRPLFRRSVLFVVPAEGGRWEAVRLAREAGACVTALCPAGRVEEARAAGADATLDPTRTDPTWYRGAWFVIVDPGGEIGFRRAMASLSPDGVYVAPSPRPSDRLRALVARLNGGPRLLRLRE